MRITSLILWTASLVALSTAHAMYGGGSGAPGAYGSAAPTGPARGRGGGIPNPYGPSSSGAPTNGGAGGTGGGGAGGSGAYGVYVAPPSSTPQASAPRRAGSPSASRPSPAAAAAPSPAPRRAGSPSASRPAPVYGPAPAGAAAAAHPRGSLQHFNDFLDTPPAQEIIEKRHKNYTRAMRKLDEMDEQRTKLTRALAQAETARDAAKIKGLREKLLVVKLKEEAERIQLRQSHVRYNKSLVDAYVKAGGMPGDYGVSTPDYLSVPKEEQITAANEILQDAALPPITKANIQEYDWKAVDSTSPQVLKAVGELLEVYLTQHADPSHRLELLAQEMQKRAAAGGTAVASSAAAAAAGPSGSAGRATLSGAELERVSRGIRAEQVAATNALLAEYHLPALPERVAGSRKVADYAADALARLSEKDLARLERKLTTILPKPGQEVTYEGRKYAYPGDLASGRVEDLLKHVQAQKEKRVEAEKPAAAAASKPSLTPAQEENLARLQFWEAETKALLYNSGARAAPFTQDWDNAPETLLPFWERQVEMVNHLVPEATRRDTPGGRKVYENLLREVVALDTILETGKRHPQINSAYKGAGGLAKAWSRLSNPDSLTPKQVARIKALIKAERAADKAKPEGERSPIFAKYWQKFRALHRNWIIEHQEFCRENPTHSACSEI